MTTIVVRPFADPHMQKLAEWTASMLDASGRTASEIGCSPAAVVAQAAQESFWGASAIGNNLFGIKADPSWAGARRLVRTREVIDGRDVMMDCWFRDYPTLAEGIEDHFLFLRNNGRYANVFDRDDSKSDQDYFEDLQKDGYATDPQYAQRLDEMLDSIHMLMEHMSDNGAPAIQKPPRLLLIGCSPGPDVSLLQSALKTAGYYSGSVDGDFGRITKDAVTKLQIYKGLVPDGIVGQGTRAALGI